MYTCHSMDVQCVCVYADILQVSKTWLATVHLMTLPNRSLRALNFVPSKSYFMYSTAVLHVSETTW